MLGRRARLPAGAGALARPRRRGALADPGGVGAAVPGPRAGHRGDRERPGDRARPAGDLQPGGGRHRVADASRHPVVPARLTGRAPRLAAGGAADSGVAALPGARRRGRSRQDAPRRGRLRQAGAQSPRGPQGDHPPRAEPDRPRRGPAGSDRVRGGRARRPVDRGGVHRLAQHRARRGAPDVGDRALWRRRHAGQPLRAQLPRSGGRAAAAPDDELQMGSGRRGTAVRRRRAPDAARRTRPVRRRRQGRRARGRRGGRLRDARLQRAVVHLVAEPVLRVLPRPADDPRGNVGQRRRADRVRLGPAADVHVAEPLVAAHRRRVQHRLPVAGPGSGPSWRAATASIASTSRTTATASTSSATRSSARSRTS